MLISSIQMCTIVLFLLSISWEILNTYSLILYVLSDYFFHVGIINFHASVQEIVVNRSAKQSQSRLYI